MILDMVDKQFPELNLLSFKLLIKTHTHTHTQLKLTPQYLELERIRSLSRNTKLYFGNNIPNLFLKEGTESQGSQDPIEIVSNEFEAGEPASQ